MRRYLYWVYLVSYLWLSFATPVKRNGLITALSGAQVLSFKQFTHYASAAYCNASSTLTWSCGEDCDANPSFIPVASGGDGDGEQWCAFAHMIDIPGAWLIRL